MTHEVTSPARSEPRWAESAASQAAERKTQYYSLLYREMAERKRVEAHLRQSNALLVALGEAQLRFVSGSALGAVLHDLLASLLTITQSAAGLIGEQIESPAAPPTCQIHALAGTYPDGAGHAWVTLVDRVLATGKPAGDPPFAGAGREIFPQLLGLPISIGETVVGVLVLADCADGFLPDILSLLQPALSTCAQLILAHRNEQRRKAAEQALAEERASLARRVAESTVELRLANAELTHAAHAKDEFLATINHELRTPLNSILLFAEILRKHNALLLEDDPYSDLRYAGERVPPIKSLATDNVVYSTTLSKTFAPGLRIGVCVAPEFIQRWLVTGRQGVDLHTNTLAQALAAEYLSGGYLDRQLPKIIELYAPRQQAMLEALERHLPEDFTWSRPEGGMFVWIEGPKGFDAVELQARVVERGVAFVPGRYFYVNEEVGAATLRMNFTAADPATIEHAVSVIADAIAEML